LLSGRLDVETVAARNIDENGHLVSLGAAGIVLCLSLLLVAIGRSAAVSWDRWPRTAWQLPLVAGVAAWNLMLVGSDALSAQGGLELLAIVARAAPQLALPLALCVLVFRQAGAVPRDLVVRVAVYVLSLSMVAAFALLGWRAVHFDPLMVDALLGTFHNVLHVPLSDDVAHYIVCAVGIVSAALAVVMLFFRWQGTAVAMAAISACWLLLGLGEGGLSWIRFAYPHAAANFAIFAAPVAMVWLQSTRAMKIDAAQDDATDDELVIVET